MTHPIKICMSEVVSSMEASARFCKAVADAMSADGDSDRIFNFDMLAQMIGECAEYARRSLNDPSDPLEPVAWRDAEGVITVGSERRPNLLTDDQIEAIKNLGLF